MKRTFAVTERKKDGDGNGSICGGNNDVVCGTEDCPDVEEMKND